MAMGRDPSWWGLCLKMFKLLCMCVYITFKIFYWSIVALQCCVSTVQQSVSVICIHVSSLYFLPASVITEHWGQLPALLCRFSSLIRFIHSINTVTYISSLSSLSVCIWRCFFASASLCRVLALCPNSVFTCRFVFGESQTLVLWASLSVWVLMGHGFFVTGMWREKGASPAWVPRHLLCVSPPQCTSLVQADRGLSWPKHLTLWLLWTRAISSCFLMFEKSRDAFGSKWLCQILG